MDYEKLYKDALERAREFQHDNCWVTTIFPELKESEDEKIRKEIIEYLRFKYESPNAIRHDYEKWIDWLEKQDEKKSSDEVLKIRQEVYQSGYNDGYKHGCKDTKKQGEWNEKDRTMAFTLIRDVDQMSYISKEGKNKRLEWLNSLEDRFNNV